MLELQESTRFLPESTKSLKIPQG